MISRIHIVRCLHLFAFVVAVNCEHKKRTSALEVASAADHSFKGKIWVLLVAGSENWYNYRHQADVCHAYQVCDIT